MICEDLPLGVDNNNYYNTTNLIKLIEVHLWGGESWARDINRSHRCYISSYRTTEKLASLLCK